MKNRRTLLLGAAILGALHLSGCASTSRRDAAATRSYCMETLRVRRRVCTPQPTPSADMEAQAKLFGPSPSALTVYVVRWAPADGITPLTVWLDDTIEVGTLPRSLIRFRLAPGQHRLSFTWDGRTRQHVLEGSSGEVLFVELAGSSVPLAAAYHWSMSDPSGARTRGKECRLVADIDRLSGQRPAHESADRVSRRREA